MSKYNITERIKQWRKRRSHTKVKMAFEIHRLNNAIEMKDSIISELRDEISDLKEIDKAIQDFNLEKLKKQLSDLEYEGFQEIIAHRQPRRHR